MLSIGPPVGGALESFTSRVLRDAEPPPVALPPWNREEWMAKYEPIDPQILRQFRLLMHALELDFEEAYGGKGRVRTFVHQTGGTRYAPHQPPQIAIYAQGPVSADPYDRYFEEIIVKMASDSTRAFLLTGDPTVACADPLTREEVLERLRAVLL